jgi:hypothetical protein
VVEVIIALVVFAILGIVLMDILSSETRNTNAMMDDLTLNKEARAILQVLSRDVRSATSIGQLDPSQVNPNPALVGVDERLARLTLLYQAPASDGATGDLKRFQIEYRVVGRGQTPPSSLPAARPRTYRLAGGSDVAVFPVLREMATFAGTSTAPQVQDVQVVGWVRGLSFYQVVPTQPGLYGISQPTVLVKLTMSAFKQGPAGNLYLEAYREDLSTGLTARGIVPGIAGQL